MTRLLQVPSIKNSQKISRGDNMKCFGKKQELAIEYEIVDEESYFEFWVDNKPLCRFCRDENEQQYKWELSHIIDWLVENEQYILEETEFPLQVNANSSLEFFDKSGEFDSDDIEEFDKWFEKRQDWYFRHSWYSNRAGSFLAEVMFRRVGEKIEIQWDNTCLYEGIEFINPKGIYYVDVSIFQQVIHGFIEDYQYNHKFI